MAEDSSKENAKKEETVETTDKSVAKQEKAQIKADKKEEKRKKKAKADKDYKDNEIKYGIRYKLILIVSLIILGVVLVITGISTSNQTDALLNEKKKQGIIIVRGLNSAIKSRLIDTYGSQGSRIERMQKVEELSEFYEENGFSEDLFEDIDQVQNQPDVIYAYALGKHEIVLSHTDTTVQPYTIYKFRNKVTSYFEAYKTKNLQKVEPITRTITVDGKDKKGKSTGKKIEVIDFAQIIAFKKDADLSDAIGEIHIGISLESVNEQIFNNTVQMQGIGLISILIGVFLSILVATFIARPIRQMIEGMRQVSEGNFQASVLVQAKDEVGLLSRTFNVMLQGLSILVSPEVAQVVLSGGDLMKSGQRKTVTVLFSDIRAFTTISETLTPPQVVEMLNDYMEIMTETIIKYGGVVDKFVGDEIFAVYGAPFDHPMHPLCATATAIEMGEELSKHNIEREAEGKLPISIGIGVNTGDVIAGAMGSKKRIDFTSIGDAVNLGARLEGTNKVYGTLAIISEFTYSEVKEDIVVRELDLIRVKGKLEPVQIFELVALKPTAQEKLDKYTESIKK